MASLGTRGQSVYLTSRAEVDLEIPRHVFHRRHSHTVSSHSLSNDGHIRSSLRKDILFRVERFLHRNFFSACCCQEEKVVISSSEGGWLGPGMSESVHILCMEWIRFRDTFGLQVVLNWRNGLLRLGSERNISRHKPPAGKSWLLPFPLQPIFFFTFILLLFLLNCHVMFSFLFIFTLVLLSVNVIASFMPFLDLSRERKWWKDVITHCMQEK